MELRSNAPDGALERKWDSYRADLKLVNPANKRKFSVIVVGTGLAGASAAATLAELGYNVHAVTYHDSPRRAHSIAAQGGINAAKNYQNDGDSVYRLFYDTIKGGDFRAREANVYRLAQATTNIHTHTVCSPLNAQLVKLKTEPRTTTDGIMSWQITHNVHKGMPVVPHAPKSHAHTRPQPLPCH